VKQKMNRLDTITLYIDTREKNPHPYLTLRGAGINIVKQQLELGDYLLTNGEKTVYVELKIENDILSSMYDNRLSAQLTKLSMKEYSMLVHVGDMFTSNMMTYLPTNLQNIQTLVSIATSIALKKGENRVGFVQYENMDQFEMGLYYIAKKLHNDLTKGGNEMIYDENLLDIKSVEKIYEVSEEDRIKKIKTSIIMRIPRIGYKTALNLLEHFNYDMKTILYEAESKDITAVKGVGKKTFEWIEKIYR